MLKPLMATCSGCSVLVSPRKGKIKLRKQLMPSIHKWRLSVRRWSTSSLVMSALVTSKMQSISCEYLNYVNIINWRILCSKGIDHFWTDFHFLQDRTISRKWSTNQQNYRMMLFLSKQVSLPKISSFLQKMEIGPKSDVLPFCMKSFQLLTLNERKGIILKL